MKDRVGDSHEPRDLQKARVPAGTRVLPPRLVVPAHAGTLDQGNPSAEFRNLVGRVLQAQSTRRNAAAEPQKVQRDISTLAAVASSADKASSASCTARTSSDGAATWIEPRSWVRSDMPKGMPDGIRSERPQGRVFLETRPVKQGGRDGWSDIELRGARAGTFRVHWLQCPRIDSIRYDVDLMA